MNQNRMLLEFGPTFVLDFLRKLIMLLEFGPTFVLDLLCKVISHQLVCSAVLENVFLVFS